MEKIKLREMGRACIPIYIKPQASATMHPLNFFDYDSNFFTIERTKAFVPRIPLMPTQEINEIKVRKS